MWPCPQGRTYFVLGLCVRYVVKWNELSSWPAMIAGALMPREYRRYKQAQLRGYGTKGGPGFVSGVAQNRRIPNSKWYGAERLTENPGQRSRTTPQTDSRAPGGSRLELTGGRSGAEDTNPTARVR